jgi:hypothetical protein
MALKQLGRNDYQNACVRDIEKGNNIPPWNPLWAAVQPLAQLQLPALALTLVVLIQYTVSGKGPISSLHMIGAHHEYLNLKLFHLFSFEKCAYFLMKTFIQIHMIFLKISGRARPWSPCGWAAPS